MQLWLLIFLVCCCKTSVGLLSSVDVSGLHSVEFKNSRSSARFLSRCKEKCPILATIKMKQRSTASSTVKIPDYLFVFLWLLDLHFDLFPRNHAVLAFIPIFQILLLKKRLEIQWKNMIDKRILRVELNYKNKWFILLQYGTLPWISVQVLSFLLLLFLFCSFYVYVSSLSSLSAATRSVRFLFAMLLKPCYNHMALNHLGYFFVVFFLFRFLRMFSGFTAGV